MSEKEVKIQHPMEQVLDLEDGSTPLTIAERSTELMLAPEFDDKDKEVEGQFQEVYDLALSAYETQAADAEVVEPKYKARNQEVAVQYLNTALSAAKEKATLKQHKDKLNVDKVKGTGPKTLNQNLIVADRNEVLKTLFSQEEK